MDPDPDSTIFVIDLQDSSKKLIFNKKFSAYYFLKVHLHHFSTIKRQKESQNRRNQGFSYYFCMMIEGAGSGSIPLTSGSGSGSRSPKNMWIRIRNTLIFLNNSYFLNFKDRVVPFLLISYLHFFLNNPYFLNFKGHGSSSYLHFLHRYRTFSIEIFFTNEPATAYFA